MAKGCGHNDAKQCRGGHSGGFDHTHRTPLFKHDFPGWRTQITSLGWSQHDSVVAAYAR